MNLANMIHRPARIDDRRADPAARPEPPGPESSLSESPLPGTPALAPLESPPLGLRLFDPRRLFAALDLLTAPLAWARGLVIPAALVAAYGAAFHWNPLLAHSDRMRATLSLLQNVVASLLAANLLGKVALGVAMNRQGVASRELGIKLLMGVLPRFYVDQRPIALLDPMGQRRCYAAPLLMRLFLFAWGILTWIAVRRTGSGLADFAVVMAGVGLASFLFTANPLWPADGYHWLAARLGRPRLRAQSMRVLVMGLRGRGLPQELPRGEFWLLLVYAVASLIFTTLLVVLVVSSVAYALESNLRGTGVVIFAILLAIVLMVLVGRSQSPPRRGSEAGAVPGGRRSGARGGAWPRAEAAQWPRSEEAAAAGRPVQSKPRAALGARAMEEDRMTIGRRLNVAAGSQPGARTTSEPAAASPDPLAGLPHASKLGDEGLIGLFDEEDWEDRSDEDLDLDDEAGAHRSARERPVGPDPSLDDLLGLPEEAPSGHRAPGRNATEPAPPQVPPEEAPAAAAPDSPREASRGEAGRGAPRPSPEALASLVLVPSSRSVLAQFERGGSQWRDAERAPDRARGRSSERLPDRVPERMPAMPVGRPVSRAGHDDLDRLLKVGAARPSRARRWIKPLVWLLVAGGLLWVAFLPYPFEVGGEFTVQPFERAEARSRTDGEIIEINVDEGEWVEAGDVMAVLSNWDELRDVALNEADGRRLQADLATLQAGATPEQRAVAEQAVATADLGVATARTALERDQALFASGTIPQATLDKAQAEFDLAAANRAAAAAQLAVVSAPAAATEVEAVQASIARNEEETAYSRLLLEYTNVRAPVAGQVVSSLADVPLGAYLTTGGLFAELEDGRTVVAEVEVPETTIAEVETGAAAELRLWSDPETPIAGTVRSISPRAEQRDFGWVIRVQVEVPNPDGRLAANMTGFGKVSAAERPVWQAFSRAIERFFVIELWSWLP